jgi:hypothetical protein
MTLDYFSRQEDEMVTRFNLVGTVLSVEEPRVSQTNVDTVILNVGDDEEESFPIMLQGKLCQLVIEKKLVTGDKIYIDGRIRKDKTFGTAGASKSVVMFFAAFVSVLPW